MLTVVYFVRKHRMWSRTRGRKRSASFWRTTTSERSEETESEVASSFSSLFQKDLKGLKYEETTKD